MKELTKKHLIAHESKRKDTSSITSTSDRLQNERLSDYLIRKGVLSKEMISQIRLELDDSKKTIKIPKTLKKMDNTKNNKKTTKKPKKK